MPRPPLIRLGRVTLLKHVAVKFMLTTVVAVLLCSCPRPLIYFAALSSCGTRSTVVLVEVSMCQPTL